MSAFCKVTINNQGNGRTLANGKYILREKACERWETHNIEDYERMGITEKQQKKNVAKHLNEFAEKGRGNRKDYRVILSFKGKEISTEKTMNMAREFVNKKFPENKAILSVHNHSNNRHVHILVSARNLDGKKLNLSPSQYKSFDKAWARIVDKYHEKGAEKEHQFKCDQTAALKKAYVHNLTDVPLNQTNKNIVVLKIQERLKSLKNRVKSTFQKVKNQVLKRDKDPIKKRPEYKKGTIYNLKQWAKLRAKATAGIIKKKSPSIIKINTNERQNIGKRLYKEGQYYQFDGLKGFVINKNDYGKNLYFIPNSGEVYKQREELKKQFDQVKQQLGKEPNLELNKYQFNELKKTNHLIIIETKGPWQKGEVNGRSIIIENTGRGYKVNNWDQARSNPFNAKEKALSFNLAKDGGIER
jgi:hypothetical protein